MAIGHGALLTRTRKQVIVLAALVAIAPAFFALFRSPSTPTDLASYLPDKGGTLLSIDVDGMRKSGLLNMLAGAKAAEEPEYKDFVQQTGFDYKHDLDALVSTFRSGQIFFVLRGRFQWDRIRDYAMKHGGTCKNTHCAMDGSKPERRISFYRLRSDLMALAISPDDMASYQIARNASKVSPFTPDAPIWVLVPAAVLKEANSLPAGTRAFTMALENAERVVFSAGPEGDHLQLSLDVTCSNIEAASALLVQLENTTNTLRRMLSREHQEANPADISGVLVSGSFRRDDRKVLGQWPIQRVFVDALTGGAH